MMEKFEWLPQWLWTLGVFLVVLFALLGVKRVIWRRLQSWARTQQLDWQKELLGRTKAPTSLLVIFISIGIAGQLAPAAVKSHMAAILGVKIGLIAMIMLIADRVISVLFVASTWTSHFSKSMRFLFLTILRVTLFSLGSLVVLDTLGISITPILASLGVGSVAVALALQDTLTNFFGGLYLLIDEPVRLGDFVRLDDGTEGTVERIGWRSTRVRTPADTMVVVPNSKLASAKLTNFDAPDKEVGFGIDLGVSYDCNLAQVETVTCEVAKWILQNVPGGVPTFEPCVRYTKIGETRVEFSVMLRAQQITDLGLIRHEFIMALHHRFAREGISPFPRPVAVQPKETV